jgi:hypothetical protein
LLGVGGRDDLLLEVRDGFREREEGLLDLLQISVWEGSRGGRRGFGATQDVFDDGVGKENLKVWAYIGLERGGGVLFNVLEERVEVPIVVMDCGNFGHDGGMGKRCVPNTLLEGGLSPLNDVLFSIFLNAYFCPLKGGSQSSAKSPIELRVIKPPTNHLFFQFPPVLRMSFSFTHPYSDNS